MELADCHRCRIVMSSDEAGSESRFSLMYTELLKEWSTEPTPLRAHTINIADTPYRSTFPDRDPRYSPDRDSYTTIHHSLDPHPDQAVACRPAFSSSIRSTILSLQLNQISKALGKTAKVVPIVYPTPQNIAAYMNLPFAALVKTDPSASFLNPHNKSKGLKKDLPPHTTGPTSKKGELKLHNIPNRIPNSLVGLIDPIADATSDIQAPLANPYPTIPITTAGVLIGLAVQKAKTTIAWRYAMVMNIFHIPNLSAMKPERARPRKEPAWRIAMLYEDVEDGRLLEDDRTGALKYGEGQLDLSALTDCDSWRDAKCINPSIGRFFSKTKNLLHHNKTRARDEESVTDLTPRSE